MADKALDIALGPLAQNFTFGTVAGACSGYAVKRVSKQAAYYVGIAFIFLQFLQYKGYIQVKWGKVAEDLEKQLDQDGDGKFDKKDMKVLMGRFMEILQTGIPSGAGFSAGFYAALRWY
eukprot:PhF_6_TR7428/c0_g1_i1/m.11112/K17986/FUNDC1; FUN14 domain-containing protein 1